ncbi:MAG: hypothetical protein R3E74_04030 [Pseudomonadales bacterium]
MLTIKQILLRLTLLVFLGQGFSTLANPCLPMATMSDTGLDGTMTMAMDHSSHETSTVDPASSVSHCDMQDCGCDLGGCASGLLSSAQAAITPLIDSLESQYQNSQKNQVSSSLFRPPISC